jgi:hypothetical protein
VGAFLDGTTVPFIDCVWNVMVHSRKPDFVFRRNGRVHLNRRGRQFCRLLAAEVCASAVIMLNTPCSEVVWRVLATHSLRQFPLHFPSRASPCAITFQLDSTVHKYFSIIKGCYLVTEASSKGWNLSWSCNLAAFLYKNPNTKTFVNIPADPTRMRTEFNLEPCGVSCTRYFTLRWIMFRDVCPEVTNHKLALLPVLHSISWLEMVGACPGDLFVTLSIETVASRVSG